MAQAAANTGLRSEFEFFHGHYDKHCYLPLYIFCGDHVLCAVTGVPIGLDELRYWSVARQEPYATAAISVQAALDAARGA